MSDKSKGVTEKFDREVAMNVADDLEDTKIDLALKLYTLTQKIRKALSIDGVMKAKKMFMLELLDAVPLNVDSCYFCQVHYDALGCKNCSYAKIHGSCLSKGSTFLQLEGKVDELRNLIDKTYW